MSAAAVRVGTRVTLWRLPSGRLRRSEEERLLQQAASLHPTQQREARPQAEGRRRVPRQRAQKPRVTIPSCTWSSQVTLTLGAGGPEELTQREGGTGFAGGEVTLKLFALEMTEQTLTGPPTVALVSCPHCACTCTRRRFSLPALVWFARETVWGK